MITIKRMPQFDAWFAGIKDDMTRRRLLMRLRKVSLGNLGDVKPVGDGVWRCASSSAPAGACTTCMQGSVLVVMLGGGDKSNQSRDIEAAKSLAQNLI